MDFESRIIGCIIGLSCGDALGAPLDGAKPGAIRAGIGSVGDYVQSIDVPGAKPHRWRMPGMYTAHSQSALALLCSCGGRRGFDPDAAAALLVKLSRADASFHYGVLRGAEGGLRQAIENLKPGTAWRIAAVTWDEPWAAARVAPVAIRHANEPHILKDKIIESAAITHRSPISVSAAAAAAFLVRDALSRGDDAMSGTPGDLVSLASSFCRETEERMAAGYADLFDGLPESAALHAFSATLEGLSTALKDGKSPEEIEKWIAANASARSGAEIKRPTLPNPLACCVYAIYTYAANRESFGRAVTAAVSQGGAASAAGAIAGAAAGALHGEAGIPENLLKNLANRKRIKTLAQSLATGRGCPEMAELYEGEYALTRKEQEWRTAAARKMGVSLEPEKKQEKRPADNAPRGEKFDRKKYEKQIKKEKRESREKFFR